MSIQRAAGWTSTRQIRTYDLSDAEDAFKIELVKRGLLQDKRYAQFQPSSKTCAFCRQANGLSDAVCSRCMRPLDRERLVQDSQAAEREHKEQENLRNQLSRLQAEFSHINRFMNRLVSEHPDLLEEMARLAASNGKKGLHDQEPVGP